MNTLRTTWGTARITAVALTVLLLATCSGGVTGIFYTLATQTSRADRNLPNNVAFNVVRAGDRFYVAALSLYSTGKIGDKWSTVNHPQRSGAEVVNVLSLAYHPENGGNGGHLYAGFLFDGPGDTDTFGLYLAEPRKSGPLEWKDQEFDKQVVRLLVVNGALLAITVEGNTWALYHLGDQGFRQILASAPDDNENPVPISDVAHDGTAYWVTTDSALHSGALDSLEVPEEASDRPPGSKFVGVISVDHASLDNCCVYLSDRTGNVHWHDGTQWQSQAITADDEPLTEFVVLPDDEKPKILVGTESLGFYSFEAGDDGSPTAVTRHPHFTNEALYNAHVQRFAYLPEGDPEGDSKHLFAITFTDGLFSTTTDSLDNWNQE